MLYIVPTPIGNLEDITLRALRILKEEVAVVLAEDTRTSRVLFDRYGIKTPLRAYHAHNEHASLRNLIEQLKSGVNMALISDAGTPGISDPGFLIARECARENIEVVCLPGATAFVPALVMSGLPCSSFHFEGFLPHKKGRQTRLKALALLDITIVLYESPFRTLKCLEELSAYLGETRQAAVCREISKLHEEIKRGSLAELVAHYKATPPKGEVVIIVGSASEI